MLEWSAENDRFRLWLKVTRTNIKDSGMLQPEQRRPQQVPSVAARLIKNQKNWNTFLLENISLMFPSINSFRTRHTVENHWAENIYWHLWSFRERGTGLVTKTSPIVLHLTGVNLRLWFYQCFNFPSVFNRTMKTVMFHFLIWFN